MKIPLIYLFIHERLKIKCRGIDLEVKEAFNMLGYVYHIKKEFRYPILKELEDFKLISKTKNKISVLKSSVDMNNKSKIYRTVGLY